MPFHSSITEKSSSTSSHCTLNLFQCGYIIQYKKKFFLTLHSNNTRTRSLVRCLLHTTTIFLTKDECLGAFEFIIDKFQCASRYITLQLSHHLDFFVFVFYDRFVPPKTSLYLTKLHSQHLVNFIPTWCQITHATPQIFFQHSMSRFNNVGGSTP